MGKKDKNKKKGKGAEKTAMKTDKKLAAKQKKMLEKLGEVCFFSPISYHQDPEYNWLFLVYILSYDCRLILLNL